MSNRTLRAICPLVVFPFVVCILRISITPLEFAGPLRAGKSAQPGERRMLELLALNAVSFLDMKQHNTSRLRNVDLGEISS
jgi:hypothetical protein